MYHKAHQIDCGRSSLEHCFHSRSRLCSLYAIVCTAYEGIWSLHYTSFRRAYRRCSFWLLADRDFRSDMDLEQRQSVAELAMTSRNMELVSHKTQSDVQAMAAPIHHMDASFDLLLQQSRDTTARLSQMQVQAQRYYDIGLDTHRDVSDQHRLLL